jgi:mono/diheme cytochrome c family protein
MAEMLLLGLFQEAPPTADTLDDLRKLGVPEDRITVITGIPLKPEVVGRRHGYRRLIPIALIGALLGLLAALFLTVGTPLLFPVTVGGQANIPIPPSIIIVFELTMLGAMLGTFIGLFAESLLAVRRSAGRDLQVSEDRIGLLLQVDETVADQAEAILKTHGADQLQREALPQSRGRRIQVRWVFGIALLLIVLAIGGLIAYGIIPLPFPSQMVEQVSVDYQQGPRLAAPAESIPFQGPDLIGGQPASAPLPATSNSIQRGQILFDLNCSMCHGQDGTGNGPLKGYFSPPPVDLTGSAAQSLSDAGLFLVITQGFGPMPSLAENLNPAERWDVVNYVRTLKK